MLLDLEFLVRLLKTTEKQKGDIRRDEVPLGLSDYDGWLLNETKNSNQNPFS